MPNNELPRLPRGVSSEWIWVRCVPEPNTGCWLWLGAVDGCGYGKIQRATPSGTRNYGIHRLAFQLAHGPVPAGHVVMHRCDNPPCVNPAHLTHGTVADNAHDRDRKGRRRSYALPPLYGEDHGQAKLTAFAVSEARRRHAAGETIAALAAENGVTGAAMGLAIRRKTWSHVP